MVNLSTPCFMCYYDLVQFFRELLDYHFFKEGSQPRTKILDRMTRKKIRDSNFLTGNLDPTIPWWAPPTKSTQRDQKAHFYMSIHLKVARIKKVLNVGEVGNTFVISNKDFPNMTAA